MLLVRQVPGRDQRRVPRRVERRVEHRVERRVEHRVQLPVEQRVQRQEERRVQRQEKRRVQRRVQRHVPSRRVESVAWAAQRRCCLWRDIVVVTFASTWRGSKAHMERVVMRQIRAAVIT